MTFKNAIRMTLLSAAVALAVGCKRNNTDEGNQGQRGSFRGPGTGGAGGTGDFGDLPSSIGARGRDAGAGMEGPGGSLDETQKR